MPSPQALVATEGPSKTKAHTEITVRQYRPEDHAAVTKIYIEGFLRLDDDEKFRYLWEERLRIDLLNEMNDIEASHMATGGNFWVATATSEGKSKIVGIVGFLRRSESGGELRRLFVDTSCHRMGIGRKLVQQVEQWTEQSGYESVYLTTNPKSKQAVGFYTSMGYELHEEKVLLWKNPKYFEAYKFFKQF